MSKRGPKPKPTPLKILEGAQRCRINFDEPVIRTADLEPPHWLCEAGMAHWRELAPILASSGLLSQGDRAALAQLCDDFATIMISRDVDLGGLKDDDGDADDKKIRRLLANADKARDRYRRMLTEFGLTPSSRTRIKAPVEKPKDALDEFDREWQKA